MKKLFLILSAMLLCIGCTTDTTTDIEVLPQSEREIYISLESSPLSRIELNEDCKTVWTESDQVSVFNKTNGNDLWRFRGDTGQRNGIFIEKKKGNSTATIDKVVVVYPYNENYTLATTDKSVLARLSAEQTYQKGSYGVGANLMVSQSDNNNFVLKSVCGWLKFQFVGTGVVSKIEFSGNDDEQVAGKITVNYSTYTMSLIEDGLGDAADDEVGGTLVSAEDYVTTVALNCGDGVALDTESVTDFYLVLPPQTFRKGITVKVTCTDGTVVEKSTTSPLTISRNTIQPMAALTINGKPAEPASNEIWYTATEKVVKDNWTVDTFGANITDHTFDTTTGKGVITFDGEVTEIGWYAFSNCSGLTSVTIPDSVTEIGSYAFHDCDSLTSVTIPDSVTVIGDGAFELCYGLTSITIPDSVTDIGVNPFYDCANIVEFNGKFATSDKKAIIEDNVLIAYAVGCIDTEYTIPDGVTEIGDYAFYWCQGLTSITIPDSVMTIGFEAFEYCYNLTSITIPDSVTSIGVGAFELCYDLTSVFCERTTPPTALYANFWNAFNDNAAGRKIYVPAESVDAYKEADGWKEYADAIVADPATLPASNEIWYTATEKVVKDNWTVDTFGANITDHTFDTTTGKGVITFDGEVTEIGSDAFSYRRSLTSITIPNSVTDIGYHAFSDCTGLTSVTIPDSVTKIGDAAFYDCDGLTSITIPDSVTSIGNNPFYYCKNLAEFKGKFASADGRCLIVDGVLKSFAPAGLTQYTIPNDVTEIENGAFCHCSGLTSVTIPDSVTKIGNDAFISCVGLTSITIPGSVTSIVNNPFVDCDYLAEFKGKFASEDGRCLIVDGILKSFAPAGLTEYTIPDSVTEIGYQAFFSCDGLTSIIIPDSVTEIGRLSFDYCRGLTSVFCERTTPPTANFEGYSSWYAFDDNAADRKIYVPAESVDAYKSADGWKNYADSIEPYDFSAVSE